MATEMDTDFPRLLYKPDPNGEPVWDLGNFAVMAVADQAAQDAALADSWTLRADDEPIKPRKATPKTADADAAG